MGTGVDTGGVAGDRRFWLADSRGEVGGRWVAGRQAAVCITGSLGSCPRSPVMLEARWSRWAPRSRPPLPLPFCSSAWWQGTGGPAQLFSDGRGSAVLRV